MQRHRTEHKMGTQGFNTDPRDETKNVTIFENYMKERVYISSDNKMDGTYSDAEYNNDSSIVKRGVSGIGIEDIDIFYSIPNVNGNNNVIRWQEGLGPQLTATIKIGHYEDYTALYTEIIDKLNSNPLSNGTYTYEDSDLPSISLKSTISFVFLECNFINNGGSLHGLYYTDFDILEYKSVPYLLSTSYIDIVISDILNGQIAQSSYGKQQLFNTTQHLARIIVDLNGQPIQHIKKSYEIINYIPFRHRDIKNINIMLLDENNNILWSSVVSHDGKDYELKYLKYFMTLNTVF